MNNNLSAIQIIKDAISLCNFDYLDEDFDLFNEYDENSRFYLKTLKDCIQMLSKDLFDKLDSQFQEIIYIKSKQQNFNNFYEYFYYNKDIYRILAVYNGKTLLSRVERIDEIKNGTYLVQPYSLRTSIDYKILKIIYLSNAIFLPENESIIDTKQRKTQLESNTDLILLESDLLTLKVAETASKFRGQEYSQFSDRYAETLNYYISKNINISRRIDLRKY